MKGKIFSLIAAAAAVFTFGAAPKPAQAQDFWIGQILLGGWNFCPRTTTPAAGQLLAISSNTALFSLYGTTYGGDGRTTFGLPDLRGRYATSNGQQPGLSFIRLGEKGGAEQHTLNITQMPSHNHLAQNTVTTGVMANTGPSESGATGKGFASGATIYSSSGVPRVQMMDDVVTTNVQTTILNNGGNLPFNIKDPYLGLQYCVVLFGIFPSRS